MAYLDENQIGEVTEVTGAAIIIRTDGSQETATLGTEIFEGDIVETSDGGAVNIGFVDDSSFAVSSDARIAIDEFVFDPASEAGAQDFSVMKGVFMYTSGLIGRENPDSVEIDTPVGSIGIRGTIIGGNINPDGESQVTVIEGAIVVRNEGGEQLLSTQYDTVRLNSIDMAPSSVETLSVERVANDYGAIKDVSADLFSSFNDQMNEQGASEGLDESSVSEDVQAQEGKSEQESTETNTDANNPELKSMGEPTIEQGEKIKQGSSDIKLENKSDELRDLTSTDVRIFKARTPNKLVFKQGGDVDENETSGTPVGRVGPKNPTDANLTYTLTDDAGGLFIINANTGVIRLNSMAGDYESLSDKFYDIKVRATHPRSGQTREFDLRVDLNDLNDETPTNLTLSNNTMNEGAVGVIGTLDATDADANDTLSYSLSNDPSGLFEIVGNQLQLRTGSSLDFEAAASHSIDVEVQDAAGNATTQTFTITVSDANEVAEITNNTAANINEGTLGNNISVADLTFTEVDTVQTTSFATNDSRFQVIDNAGQLQLVALSSAIFDFETESSITVSITQTDGSNTYSDYNVVVNVADLIDEAPTDISLNTTTLAENTAGGSVVANLTTTDADAGDSHTYAIDGGHALFEIVGNEVRVRTGAQINYEAATSHSFDVTTTDSNGLTYTENVTINVTNDITEIQDIKLALKDVYDVTSGIKGVIDRETDGAAIGEIKLNATDVGQYDATDFNITGTYSDNASAAQNLSDIFEVIQDAGAFILKLQAGYSIENLNEIHNGGGQIGTLGMSGDISTITVDIDGQSHNIDFTTRIATNIEDHIANQGDDFILQNVDGVVFGTNGDDNFVVKNSTFKLIRGGSGHDTIRFDDTLGGNSDILDLTSTQSNLAHFSADLKGIEEIIISNASTEVDNILKMNVEDILDLLKTSDTQIGGKNIFKVTAADITNPGYKSDVEFYANGVHERLDQVDIDGQAGADFVANGTQNIDGHTYYVFEHDLGNVLLDANLANGATG